MLEEAISNIYHRYKRLILTAVGIYLIPTLIVIFAFIAFTIHGYFTSEMRDPYIEAFAEGFDVGLEEAYTDQRTKKEEDFESNGYSLENSTLWAKYKKETVALKKQALQEKEEYLSQFPASERAERQSEMALQKIQTPTQAKLNEGRFRYAHEFYRDLAYRTIKKSDFKKNSDYNDALSKQGWKDGYQMGYGRGAISSSTQKYWQKPLQVL